MAGIYIHIPFCKKACHYCNFHFSTSLKLTNDFSAALLKEIALQKQYLEQEIVETIYLGGGTPSILPSSIIQQILAQIYDYFTVAPDAEITLEANPDDISADACNKWRNAGINRISLGVQSFRDADLKWMNRSHSANQAKESLDIIKQEGFSNFSIDLIYGSPVTNDEAWELNVQSAIDFQVPHLSCYALTVEPKTALYKFIETGKMPPVDNEHQAKQFEQLMRWMEASGYEHYEISNFSLPGKRSRHNSAYWQGKKYLGLGPSAHSFNGRSRQWNISNNALYIQSLQQDTIPYEKEILTRVQTLNEYIMTSLRTMEGLNLDHIRRNFGEKAASEIMTGSSSFIELGKMIYRDGRLQLQPSGKLLADGIASGLFFGEGTI